MEYVIIKTGGKQHKVAAGDTLTLNRITSEKKNIVFEDVLLSVNNGTVSIGAPTVNGASVSATILEDKQGDKIRVQRFKAKSRYRRTIGFRPQQTVVKIDSINFGSSKSTKEIKEPTKTAAKEIKK